MAAVTVNTAGDQPIQPIETTRVSSPTTTVTSAQPALGEVEALNAQVAQQEAAAQAQQGVGAAQAEQAQQEAAGQDLIAQQAEVARQQTADLAKEYETRIKKAQGLADAAEERYANHKFYDYWSTHSTADHVLSKIASALGAAAGGENFALETINRKIDRDFERQKLDLASKENIAKWKRQGVTDVMDEYQHELAALQIKQAKAHEAVAATASAMAKRAGAPVEVAKNNVLVQDQLTKARDMRLQGLQRFETQVANKSGERSVETTVGKGTGGQGVEADKNAANFAVLKEHGTWIANQMPQLSPQDVRDINSVMSTQAWLEGDGTVKSIVDATAKKLGVDAETGISSTAKEYLDRVRRAAEGLGRVQSGAAIGTVEGKRFMQSLTPSVSDKPVDLKKRAERIMSDIDSRGAYMARPARNAAPATKPQTSEIAAAMDWLKKNPKDPRAPAVRAKVKALTAGANAVQP